MSISPVKPREWDEPKLLDECLRDSEKAWKEFVTRFGGHVYSRTVNTFKRYGLRHRMDLIDDTCQEVFRDLWQKNRISQMKESGAIRGLLTAITISRSVDRVRNLRRELKKMEEGSQGEELGPEEMMEGIPAANVTPFEYAARKEVMTEIHKSMDQQPWKESFILKLNVIHGMTHQKISDLTLIPVNTVSTVIRRTKEKIKQHLKKRGFDEFAA